MAIRDLIPWSRGRDVAVRRSEEVNPFLTLHREMNRLFDEAFRGFGLPEGGAGSEAFASGGVAVPRRPRSVLSAHRDQRKWDLRGVCHVRSRKRRSRAPVPGESRRDPAGPAVPRSGRASDPLRPDARAPGGRCPGV